MSFWLLLLGAVERGTGLSLNYDPSDLWWILVVAILGFFFCACCCMSCFLNFLRPWRFRRRGLPPPARRGHIRWWRRYPHGPGPAPRRRFPRPRRGPPFRRRP